MSTLRESPHKGLIIFTIMLVAILEVLDSTIVNVALPNMMASLGANQEQITWVLTSYVVASAIMLPLTGFLTMRVGRKRLLVINVFMFMLASTICGFAHTLDIMVLFRLIQGAFGATLIPLSQSILREAFRPSEQGKAMAIWGMGIMTAPVLGPTLGGFIIEHASWRWIFFINIPICIIGILMVLAVIPETERLYRKIDWTALLLMIIGIGGLQILLDQGNQHGWLQSNFILALLVLAGLALVFFVLRCYLFKPSLINLATYKDRNFTLCSIIMTLVAACLFSLIAVEPIMLEQIFNYSTLKAGLLMAPLGLASAIAMIISSILMKKINVKYIFTTAILASALSTYLFSHLTLSTSTNYFVIYNAIQGLGMGMLMVPLATYSLLTLDQSMISEGAGLFSYGRMVGTSVGISLVGTMLSRLTQANWSSFGSHISPFNPGLKLWLAKEHMSLTSPKTVHLLSNTIQQQASMQAFIDVYHGIAIMFLMLLPFVLLLRQVHIKD